MVFPVPLQALSARIQVTDIREGELQLSDYRVQTFRLRHSGTTLGYRLTPAAGGRTVAYLTDNELGPGGSYPVGDGWRVAVGRLETVRVWSLEGVPSGEPRRVVALDLHRRPGRARLHAVLDDGNRLKIMAGGGGTTTRVARWLADRADLPLRESGRQATVTGMTSLRAWSDGNFG